MPTFKNEQLIALARSLADCEPQDKRTREARAWAGVVIALRKSIRAAQALREFDAAIGVGWLPHPRYRTQEERDLARRVFNIRRHETQAGRSQ